MDFTVVSHVTVAGAKEMEGRRGREFASNQLEVALAQSLAQLDLLACLGVEQGPRVCEAVEIRYEFFPPVPRGQLHKAWRRAIEMLAQVVIVDAEDLLTGIE
jgi:hypothetical protein